MNDIMKIVQGLEDSNILLKEVTETIKNKTKKEEGEFLGTIVGTLGSVLLGSLLSVKGNLRAGSRNKKGIIRAGYGKQWDFYAASSFDKIWNTKVLSKRGWDLYDKPWSISRRWYVLDCFIL